MMLLQVTALVIILVQQNPASRQIYTKSKQVSGAVFTCSAEEKESLAAVAAALEETVEMIQTEFQHIQDMYSEVEGEEVEEADIEDEEVCETDEECEEEYEDYEEEEEEEGEMPVAMTTLTTLEAPVAMTTLTTMESPVSMTGTESPTSMMSPTSSPILSSTSANLTGTGTPLPVMTTRMHNGQIVFAKHNRKRGMTN